MWQTILGSFVPYRGNVYVLATETEICSDISKMNMALRFRYALRSQRDPHGSGSQQGGCEQFSQQQQRESLRTAGISAQP
jgi:hypothetical protein